MPRPVTKIMNEAYVSQEVVLASIAYLEGRVSQTDVSYVLMKALGRSPGAARTSQTLTNLAVIRALQHAVKLGIIEINNTKASQYGYSKPPVDR